MEDDIGDGARVTTERVNETACRTPYLHCKEPDITSISRTTLSIDVLRIYVLSESADVVRNCFAEGEKTHPVIDMVCALKSKVFVISIFFVDSSNFFCSLCP